MKYRIRIFNVVDNEESLLKECAYDYLPYIPRIGEHILCDNGINFLDDYVVWNICSSIEDYSEENEQWIEIIVKESNIDKDDKEWWE